MLLTGLYPSVQRPFQMYASADANGVYYPSLISDFKNNVFAMGRGDTPGYLYPCTFNDIYDVQTRATTAMYHGYDGLLKTAAINEIRRETYDPATVQRTTNLVRNSENLAGSPYAWFTDGGTSTPISDPVRGQIIQFTENTSSGVHGVSSPQFNQEQGNLWYTYSVSVKSNGIDYLAFTWKTGNFWGANDGHIKVDLINGIILSNSPIGAGPRSITPEGDGWYRISISRQLAFGNVFRTCSVHTLNPTTQIADAFVGQGRSFFMANPQVEYGSVFTKYVKTTTDIAVEIIKPGKAMGALIEVNRTNLFSNSGGLGNSPWQFWNGTLVSTVSQTFSPTGQGGVYASTSGIQSDGTGQGTRVSRNHTFPINTYVCVSIYMKPMSLPDEAVLGIQFNNETAFPGRQGVTSFNTKTLVTTLATGVTDGGIQKCADGWYRIWACALTSATSAAADIRFYTNQGITTTGIVTAIWGAQAEEGLFPTSLMYSLVSSTTSRAVDNLTSTKMSTINIAGTKGTLLCDVDSQNLSANVSQSFVTLSNAANSNVIYNKTGGPNGANYIRSIFVKDNVGLITNANSTNQHVKGINKTAMCWYGAPSNRAETALNGTMTLWAASGATPPTSFEQIRVGSNSGGAERGAVNILNIVYYPYALPTTELQRLTGL